MIDFNAKLRENGENNCRLKRCAPTASLGTQSPPGAGAHLGECQFFVNKSPSAIIDALQQSTAGRRGIVRRYISRFQRTHIAEEEGQKQSPDMRSVDIGIGHDNDFMIPQLCKVNFVTNAAA